MKRVLLLLMLVVANVVAFAQQKSLVVDIQTPGWLSSKIDYEDQQSVVNLTVTGYINQTDIDFINKLISSQKLHGKLDLSNVGIVGNTMTSYNYNTNCCIIIGHLSHLLLPLSLKKAHWACREATCDTITLGGPYMTKIEPDMLFFDGHDNYIKCLIFREDVDTIGKLDPDVTFGGHNFNLTNLEHVTFPSSLKKIETFAFGDKKKLQDVIFPDSIEEIGNRAFWQVPAFKDTVKLPQNLNVYYVGSFAEGTRYYSYGDYKYVIRAKIYNNQVIFVPNSVSQINFSDIYLIDSVCTMHINRDAPPSVLNSPISGHEKVNVYVPKKALTTYLNDLQWSKFNLLAEPNPATEVKISSAELSLQKGYTKSLTATILPDDADSQDIVWSVRDENIASVTQEGIVTGINSGETFLFATLKDNPTLKDSCLVKVFQPVDCISLNLTEKEIKVGESFQLIANVSPSDADNKNVIWSSNNELVAIVEDGNVVGKKAGKVAITATSASDSTISATCYITVRQPVEGISLDKTFIELSDIGASAELLATIMPEDASNDSVNWKSSDENVCIVSNGKVVAVGYGTAVVIVTTVDGGYMATCTVTVKNTTGIKNVQEDKNINYSIFTIDGNRIESLRKGINIIRFDNGQVKKYIVK